MNLKVSGKQDAIKDLETVRQYIRENEPELFAHAKDLLIEDGKPHSRHKDAMEAALLKVSRELEDYNGNESIPVRAERYYMEFQQSPKSLDAYSASAARG